MHNKDGALIFYNLHLLKKLTPVIVISKEIIRLKFQQKTYCKF